MIDKKGEKTALLVYFVELRTLDPLFLRGSFFYDFMFRLLVFFAGGTLLFLTCFLAGSALLILSSKEPKGEIVKSQTVGFISILEITFIWLSLEQN